MQALSQIRQIDYTVIFARNMDALRHFYETVMEFPLLRALSDRWIEYRVGSTTLALTTHGARFNDTPPEQGALSLQWHSASHHKRWPTARRRSKPKALDLSHRCPITPSAIVRFSSATRTATCLRSSRRYEMGAARAGRCCSANLPIARSLMSVEVRY